MRGLPSRLALRRPRIGRRALLGALAVAVLLVPGYFLLRGSSLVEVERVNVTGLTGAQAAQVRQAIEDAAMGQSTMNVDASRIREAVRPFAVVAGVSVKADLPHTLDVAVRQYVPVGALTVGNRRIAVASDGTVLEGTLTRGLPEVPASAPPGGRRVAGARELGLIRLLGAAPASLRGRVTSVSLGAYGLVARLRDGPDLRFGPGQRLQAKWIAAARVLADSTSRGAAYVDLRVPERPAAGPSESQPAVQPSQ